jgi:two-component system, sensor histidine kinase LadS
MSCLALLVTRTAHAQKPLVLEDQLAGVRLGHYVQVFEDKSGTLDITQVSAQALANQWRPTGSDAPGFGMSQSAFWLRLTVDNPAPRNRDWMLEVAYAQLDRIALYTPTENGFAKREAGDMVPFAARDVAYHHVVFAIAEPAHSQRVIYVRVQTSGSATVPLLAWTPLRFVEHQNRELAGYWLFYGVMMIMAVYNLFIYVSIRTPEYLYYVLYNLSLLLFELTLNGHTFQWLLPNHTWLANHLMPFAIGVNQVWTSLFAMEYLKLREHEPRFARIARMIAWVSAALAMFGLFGPYAVTIRVLVLNTILVAFIVPAAAIPLARKGHRQARQFLVAWGALVAGVFIYVLKTFGILPSSWLSNWGIQLGAGVEITLLSLSLADRINTMRANLAQLNAQLSQNVSDLRLALQQAEAGTRAKLDFLATVSHELRTPLNAIINIPEGILADFARVRRAKCQSCQSLFELSPEEQVTNETVCPECHAVSSLRVDQTTLFQGQPERAVRHLEQIERSGKHLLQMVNGILDFSKVSANKLSLSLERVNIPALAEETVASLTDLAKRANVELVFERAAPNPDIEALLCDRMRIQQVLINLIGNAIKFSDGRGRVTVSAELKYGSCVLVVRDQGIGIAPEDCARVFESFEQVDTGDTRKYGGTGLGLSICKALVGLHNGRIWLQSEPGVGSTFYVSLPLNGPSSLALAS